MGPDDPPRPDLDAAIDAVVPALTSIDDGVAADSLRRTQGWRAPRARAPFRVVLAARTASLAWAVTATATALFAVYLWWPGRSADASRLAVRPALPAAVVATAPPAVASTRLAATVDPRAARAAPPVPSRRVEQGRATTREPEPVRRPDPLAALVAAVQAIPEDAWTRGSTATDVAPPDVSVAPIAIAPLEVPAITDAPAEPIAPGEP